MVRGGRGVLWDRETGKNLRCSGVFALRRCWGNLQMWFRGLGGWDVRFDRLF